MAVLVIAGIPAAIVAPARAAPGVLGLAPAIVGWAVAVSFALGNVFLFWDMVRRPVARRPWILGGPPDPPPRRDADGRIG